MGDGLNRVILLGNLGADPELRYTANNTAVLSLRIATNESFLDKNREVHERTDWHSVVIWGARAEALARTLTKGTCVLVEGGLRTSSYEKDGIKRYKTEVHAKEICIASRRAAPQTFDEELAMRVPSVPRPDDELHARASSAPQNGRAGIAAMPPELEVTEEVPF
jgi:single-strand DNA-binding protein